MALSIKTTSGNRYTYLRKSNEIIEGTVEEILSPFVFNKRELKQTFPNLTVFTIAITNKCNLRCSYCCYSGEYRNTRQHGSQSISSNDIDKILDFIETYKAHLPVTISFYGGESLLEFDLITLFVTKSKQKWKDEVQFEISTNGTLLQKDNIQWMVKNEFTIFVSLDGTSKIQDRQRITKTGKGTFNIVKNALVYLYENHYDFFTEKVYLMMTVTDVNYLPSIAKDWSEDHLLRKKLPIRISPVYPNYSKGVKKANVDESMTTYLDLLDYYESHQQYSLLKVFFDRFLAEWNARPIFEIEEETDCPTCVPYNSKLYIDTDGQIGLCEKMPDAYRIGNINDGISWEMINTHKRMLESMIIKRCSTCPVARLCDICPIDIDFSEDEMDVFCHNQMVIHMVKLRVLCEMAERKLI